MINKNRYILGSLIFILLSVAGPGQAATSIGTNISTDGNFSAGGTLSAVGAATLQSSLSVNGYFGVGVASPAAHLSVYQPNTSATAFDIDTPSGFSGKVIDLKIASSSQMVLTNNFGTGYLGIGTASPAKVLDVVGGIRGNSINFTTKTHPAMVSFMFDDGKATQYTNAKSVFDSHSVPATVGVTTDNIGVGGYLTSTQIQALYADSWEITNQTKSNTNLSALTESQIRTQFTNANTAINALNIPVYDCSYPSDQSNATVRRVARDYFRACRGQSGNLNSYPLNTYNLNSLDITNITSGQLAAYEAYVDQAKTTSSWLIFHMSDVSSAQASVLSSLLDYIQAQGGISVVTLKQALDSAENEIEGGDNFRFSTGGGLYVDGGANAVRGSSYSGNVLANSATSNTASITKAGLEIQSTGTWNGSGSSNIGLYVSAVSGGTNNYDAIFNGGGNVGIGTLFPTNILSFGGNSARTIGMERNTTADSAGNDLTVQAGGPSYNTILTWHLVSGGTGYSTTNSPHADQLTLPTPVGGDYAYFTVTSVDGSGTITGLTLSRAGSNYSPSSYTFGVLDSYPRGGSGAIVSIDTVGSSANKTGGNLILKSGVSSGTGTGQVQIWTAPAGVDGTADNAPLQRLTVTSAGNVGIGLTAPTAVLHLKAGTTAASTAPLKFTSGPLMTTAEAGAIEFLTDTLYFSATNGGGSTAAKRQAIPGVTTGTAAPTTIPLRVGDIYVDTTNKKVYFATGVSSSADWTLVN